MRALEAEEQEMWDQQLEDDTSQPQDGRAFHVDGCRAWSRSPTARSKSRARLTTAVRRQRFSMGVINLQADYDMQVALDQFADELARVQPRRAS